MTKIYIYCLFEMGQFQGVYSSLKAVHRDALRLANRGPSEVVMWDGNTAQQPSLTTLRNALKGRQDVEIKYRTSQTYVTIYKTKLKE